MTDASEEVESVIGEPIDAADREALQSLVELMRPVILQTAEQTGGMARWLLASLLALNGGAIIAALNSTDIGGAAERSAIVVWLAGIVLALGSGTISMHNGQRGIAIASDMLGGIIKVLQTGAWADIRFKTESAEVARRGKLAIAVGVLSEIAFLLGAILAAMGN